MICYSRRFCVDLHWVWPKMCNRKSGHTITYSLSQDNSFFLAIESVWNTWKTRAKLVSAWHKIKNYNFQHIGFSFLSLLLPETLVMNIYLTENYRKKGVGCTSTHGSSLFDTYHYATKKDAKWREKEFKRSLTNLSGLNEWNGNKWQMKRCFRQYTKWEEKNALKSYCEKGVWSILSGNCKLLHYVWMRRRQIHVTMMMMM